MNEVNKPKKTLRYFYFAMLACLLLFNMVILPMFMNAQVKKVDYGTFMTMTEEGNIGLVQIVETENYISFTDKEQTQVYKTGIVNDPGLTERLQNYLNGPPGATSPLCPDLLFTLFQLAILALVILWTDTLLSQDFLTCSYRLE